MFTGIVEQLGRVARLLPREGGLLLEVEARGGDLEVGGSIAVNGCCLTAVSVGGTGFACEITPETQRRTAFGERLRTGVGVNLERPLSVRGRFEGHIVQGHVDGVGTIVGVSPSGDSAEIGIEVPPGLERYMVEKGSIAVDGVSLTLASVSGSRFTVAVIPYTLKNTTLGSARVGEYVNLEMDILAKYVEAMLRPLSGGKA
jgi:riboflavin synthase